MEHHINFVELRDGIAEIVEGNKLVGYCPDSLRDNPDHMRVGIIEIVQNSAPKEFLEGKPTRFKNTQLGLYIEAQTHGNYTHFRVCLTPDYKSGGTVITIGDSYSDLPYDEVKHIHRKNPELVDITQFHIGNVI